MSPTPVTGDKPTLADKTRPLRWQANPQHAVVLGDSGSTGYGTTGYTGGGDGGTWVDTPNGWAANLARMWPSSTWDVRSHNGAMVSDYLPGGRWPEAVQSIDVITAMKPQLVITMLGGNEFGTDVDPAVYEANLRTLAGGIKNGSPLTDLVFVHMWEFTYRWGTTQNHTWTEYQNAMRSVAADYGTYVDLCKYMPTAADGSGLYLTDEFGPGLSVHPTDAGNWPIFTAVRAYIEAT